VNHVSLSQCLNMTGLQCAAETISGQPLATAALLLVPLFGIMLVGLLAGSLTKLRFWVLWMSLIVFEGIGLLAYFMLVTR